LIEDSEQKLFQATESIAEKLSEQKDYKAIVQSLLELKEVIDTFFDKVMVNVDDIELRQTRLKLISRVRSLFLSVADVSYLSS
jgi:glycyl-tRNA synthetase beta chain